ncbi:MAG: hypothetical protein ACOYBY_17045 [Dermatophilaceae bacterium]
MTENNPTQPAGLHKTIRLIFEYDGDTVTLVSQHSVDMAVPGFNVRAPRQPGHYVEVRNAAGEALSSVPVRGAFTGSAEVFPENPAEPIVRVDVPRPHGAFDVVVSVPEEAERVALLRILPTSDSLARGAAPAAAQPEELATFPLDRTN